mmetsp:Transcript_9226/g.30446  ORF Transcript_9226/g.30446 Transcript_9226/m.30446 type:complete len:313 (+) Transcript_9226:120-1058(+)|eukprot:CAMPEP_0170134116 /NCGR_PEP_ID=MMETSP0033_2-20121228/1711_1 /TAXON_ID=195969 /ORGANISM="Dolichomastix tenuilepis, Strain CCMP3274" /LENGTH=312 /DNA_ID=CAMNT_0010369657 /DNA_START=105 /DNA_END=1043 /DNA_ORIENTATION=+
MDNDVFHLTQLGAGEAYTADASTSQSTVLLQKKKKMQEVQSELDRKKREYDQRMKRCKEKENELAEKQEKIRESVIRFEKFVKENDAKRHRALRKEKDEINSRKLKEQEIVALQLQLEQQVKKKEQFQQMVRKLSVYEEFLELVVESSDEFQEVNDILMRHATLAASNQDLREVVENGNLQMEELRAMLSAYTKEKEDEILVATSSIAGQQKRTEQLKIDNAKVEQTIAYRESLFYDKKRKLGEAKMAIANIYGRCRKSGSKSAAAAAAAANSTEPLNLNHALDVIMQRLVDLQDIVKMAAKAPPATTNAAP